MAFMGVLIAAGLFYVVFLIWLGVLVLGVVLLVLGILFEVFYGRNKRRLGIEGVGKKKWQKVAGIVCLVISVINLGLAGGSFYYAYGAGNEGD